MPDSHYGDERGSQTASYSFSLHLTQVLQREQSGDPWNRLETTVVRDGGVFYMRAEVHHFSEGCLAKNILVDSAIVTEGVTFGRPGKKQVEFINATRKTLTFIVVPTSWSDSAIKSFAVGLGVEGIAEVKASVQRELNQGVLEQTMAPQVLQLPQRRRLGDPEGGERCPSDMCDLREKGGHEATVALVTVEDTTVSVWLIRNVKQKTRLMVLPGQFSEGMQPLLGRHELPRSGCLVRNTLTAAPGMPMSIHNAPVPNPTSTGNSGGAGVDVMETSETE